MIETQRIRNGAAETILSYPSDEAGFIQARKHIAKYRKRFSEDRFWIVMKGDFPRFNIADLVAMSAQWVRSVGQTCEFGHYRGVVVSVSKSGIATVNWQHGEQGRIHLGNLAEVGPNLRFCTC